ncbi:RNA ligase partner protein [Alkalilimnicola ehrlichii]|uniref:RNA ligase partner protein n=1 Tax=Alkalilimnicola ehrlichii TaxID=351052 RepID=UPI0021616524|nr:RNA ligase partner protein [Alkalilimnicola ehrlichii]
MPSDFQFVLCLKAPTRDEITVPGNYLYELIDDIRTRVDRGLRVAEKAVREVKPSSVEKTITRLRDRYREALRTGLLDSTEDLDVILLAHELGAAVCSADTGLMRWAERIGLRLIEPRALRGILERLSDDNRASNA